MPFSPTPVLAVASEPVDIRTLWDFFESGGPLMVPIGIGSVLVVGFFFERLLFLRRGLVCPREVQEAATAVTEDRFDEASRLAAEHGGSAGARILTAGLRRRGYPVHDVERAMEDQSAKEVERLRGNIRPIALIGAIAPLLGLLGTVIGIADSFHGVVTTGMGKPEALAGGINEALTTTICGLTVAIPALLAAAWLQSRVRRIVAFTDTVLGPTVEAIAARPTPETMPPEPISEEADSHAA